MPIAVACNCGKKFNAKDELAGKRVKCPGCGEPIAIPSPAAAATAKTPAAAGQSKPGAAGPAARPAASPTAKPQATKPKPQATKPKPEPQLSALAGFDPLGDLGALESAANASNPLGGFGDPLGGGAQGMNALAGGNALLGGNAMGGMGGYQQQPARRSGGNTVLWVGIGGGGVALLIVIGIVVAVVTRKKPKQVAAAPANSTAKETSSTVTAPPAATAKSTTTETPKAVGEAITPTSPTVSPSPVENSTPAAIPETTPKAPDPSPAPPKPAGRQRPPGEPKPDEEDVTWDKLGPAMAQRLAKPGVLKGANIVGKEPVILAGYSWMTELLPYLGEEDRYKKFDFTKSWSERANAELTTPVSAFLNPADPRKTWKGWPYTGMGLTHFVGMSGVEDTRNEVAALWPRSHPKAGMFGYEAVARPNEITDGTSNTIMLIGAGNMSAPWVQGGGATIRGLREPYFDELTGFGSKGLTEPGAQVMMADGSVKTLSAKISPKVLKAMCTIHGAETVDQAEVSANLK